ncbi:MAG: hypothetical protein HUJ31_03110, partial [Pseudomonadales bacterium]|nr:hypothetical protein [Pseudomonadales bacterium]
GDSDDAMREKPDEILNRLSEILKEIGQTLPGTEVYLLYVKPSPSRWELWPVMKEVNERYQAICDSRPDIHCIDVASPMLNENGEPKAEIFLDDHLHMNDKGYRLWTGAARAVLFDEE